VFCGVETEIGPLLDEYWYDAPETAKAARVNEWPIWLALIRDARASVNPSPVFLESG
jgi:hypothetical protein